MSRNSSNPLVQLPFYAKISLILIGLFVFITMLALTEKIIVPLLFAVVLSILLSTVVDFLELKKINRLIAIWVTLAVAMLIVALITIWIISRLNVFIDQLPHLSDKLDVLQKSFASWLSENFDLEEHKSNEWMYSVRKDLLTISADSIGSALTTLTNALILSILIPVYIFLILYYQPLIINFIHQATGDGHAKDVGIVLGQTKTVLKGYFAGLFIEFIIVTILTIVSFWILDVESAILLGILGGLLNMIPYIGGIIMLGLSMFMAMLSSTDPKFALYAAALFFVIQIFDNYFLIPKIVGSRVKINALVAVVAVIAGGAIWGVAGMFLALPLTAILKVIFDRIDTLKPWGFLFGDVMPPAIKFRGRRKKPSI